MPKQFFTVIIFKLCKFYVNLWTLVFCVVQKVPIPFKIFSRELSATANLYRSHLEEAKTGDFIISQRSVNKKTAAVA